MFDPNSVCVNCRSAFAAHGSISQMCPDRDAFFAERASAFKRFAYVPIGEWFRINASGTTEFQKINEDEAICTKSARRYRFELDDLCAYPIALLREDQQSGIESGTALMRHVRACHGGEFLPDCPACVELKLKVGGVN